MKVLILAYKEKNSISGRHNRWIGPLGTISSVSTKLVLKSKSYVSFIFRVLWTSYRFRPDIIISMGADLIGFISILTSKLLHRPMILSSGGDSVFVRQFLTSTPNKKKHFLKEYKYKLLNYLSLWTYKNCPHFIVNSNYLRDQLLTSYSSLKDKDIFVIPQPAPKISSSKNKVILKKNNTIRVLTVTNLEYGGKYKGVIELIEFLQRYVKQSSTEYKFVFHIFGKGYFRTYLEKKLKTISEKKDKLTVCYHGFIKNTHIAYAKADIFLYSSYFFDSLPRVLMEAQAHGLPVIVNDFKPLKEFIKDGYNGLVYKSHNFESFKKKLDLLISYPNIYYSLSKNGLENLKQNYSFHIIGKKLKAVLLKVNSKHDYTM